MTPAFRQAFVNADLIICERQRTHFGARHAHVCFMLATKASDFGGLRFPSKMTAPGMTRGLDA